MKLKKIVSILFAAICILSVTPGASALEAAPTVSAQASIVYHPSSGSVIYESSAYEPMLIASTTKVMTALVVLENCALDETVVIEHEWTLTEGSSMYIVSGTEYTVEQLLYGMLLTSGNDAATALACHAAGDIESFAGLMNEKARQLELQNSHFSNPHGLDSEDHYSCAFDLALIMAEAMSHEAFVRISGTTVWTMGELTYVNHNKLLWNCDGVVAGKTGYTLAAGRTLVTCAERDGMRFICVTLNAPDDWSDHSQLYDWAYSQYTVKPIIDCSRMTVPVISGEREYAGIEPVGNSELFRAVDDELTLSYSLPRFTYAPVSAGELAGYLNVETSSGYSYTIVLAYIADVPLKEGVRLTRWEKIKHAWYLANSYPYVPRIMP